MEILAGKRGLTLSLLAWFEAADEEDWFAFYRWADVLEEMALQRRERLGIPLFY